MTEGWRWNAGERIPKACDAMLMEVFDPEQVHKDQDPAFLG
jgi:hypothetical protein